MAETLVPDTSVLIDGRITEMLDEKKTDGTTILVPLAALAELESQANQGLETGVAGLDELSRLQMMAKEGRITMRTVGVRPSADDVRNAELGAIDAMIRDTAVESGGIFVTSDRVQAHAASAQGIEHRYLRPIVESATDLTGLKLWTYFDDTTMSVHLRADCIPMVKRGKPGEVVYEAFDQKEVGHTELRDLIKECIEFAKRDYRSFVELQRHGCTVLQMGPMRVTIAQPPFSDALEITAVRPITKTTIDDYDLPEGILERIEGKSRGVFVAGPPGSGKSTFAAAVGTWLHEKMRVVKTMEQPRDLQVPFAVTQYGALDHDMQWTGEVMLLVRPDHVIYDEVRTTDDFRVFADMRLAGIGLFGVTHANRAIDAVQRLIGRVDLGMIPQIVDTVVFIDAGAVAQTLELRFTVKVPAGMTQEDLARPVVVVSDVLTKEALYELYTYGEQVVVMPLEEVANRPTTSGTSALAEKELQRELRRYVEGKFEVHVSGNRAKVVVEEWEVPNIIGRGGKTVQGLERKLGISLDIESFPKAGGPLAGVGRSAKGAGKPSRGPTRGKVKATGNNVFILVPDSLAGQVLDVSIEGAKVGSGKASQQGKIRFKKASAEGKALLQAQKAGLDVHVAP